MDLKLKRSFVVFFLLATAAVMSYAAINPFVPVFSNPDVTYKVVSTKYMDVVYQPSSEWAVYKFLENGDALYEKITDFYNIQPFSKLTVVFENDTNIVNSLADPVDNVIYIFLNSSQRGFFSSDVESWVDFVFSHELTHILLTQMGGTPQMRVYGDPLSTIYNSVFIPAYVQEGLAEYSETHFNGNKGRLNDPLFEMYLKGLVLAKRLNGLGGAASYSADGWYPMGAPYLVGGSFIRYVSSKYGEKALKKAIDTLASNHVLGVAHAFEKATKTPFKKLIGDWLSSVKKDVDSQLSKVGTRIEGVQLTNQGRWTAFVSAPSKDSVFFYSEDQNDIPKIKEYVASSAVKRDVYPLGGFLYQGGYIRSMSISPDGNKLAFVKWISQDGGFVNRSVCFVLDLKNRSLSQLPIKNPMDISWLSKDKIVYSEEDGGLYSIKEYNFTDGTFKTITHYSPMVITSLSTYKNNVYFSASVDGNEDIYEVSENGTETVKKIISGDFLKVDPFVTKDGRYILFSAAKPDKDGIFNVYAFDTFEKRFYQITNVELGAFSPHVVGDKLFYTNYTKNGYNLFALDRWMSTSREANGFKWDNEVYKDELNLTEIYLSVEKKSKPYSPPLQTIASGMLPLVSLSSLSASNTVSATYTLVGFDMLRSKFGWNNFYALGSISTDSTEDSLAFGMINYGKYNLSASAFLNLKEQVFDASLSYPITLMMWGNDFLFYPSIEYLLKHEQDITDKFSFYGEMIFGPSFVPSNVLGVHSLHMNWNVAFSPLNPSTPTYNVEVDTSFPMFYGVSRLGATFENSSIKIFQKFAFPNLSVNWYDITGVFGLKTIDFLQFSDYMFENNDFDVGLQTDVNFDSFFYSEFKLSIKVAYDHLKNGFEYHIGLNF